jgi:uncharacterized membrane protein YphA (DoxX/SURF4 family)
MGSSTVGSSTSVPDTARLLRLAGHAARLALGGVFVAAGVLKALDVAEFARQTASYGLITAGWAAFLAPILIALETTLGVALLAGWRPRLAAILVGLLLLFFIGLEAWGITQGHTEACGCFGAYVKRTPEQVILEDLGFVALAILACAGLGAWRSGARRLAGAAVLLAAGLSLGFAIASPRLPIDGLVTRLTVGRSVGDLGIASKLPGSGQDETLVALLDMADPHAKEAAADLNALAGAPGAPKVIALTPSTEQEQAAFMWDAYPAFDIVPVDRGLLKPLYRSLPRYFLVRSGRVTRVFEGPRPPSPDLLSSQPV